MHFDIRDRPPGLRNGEGRNPKAPADAQHQDHQIRCNSDLSTTSRQVAFWPVVEYINRQRKRLGAMELSGPVLGTPAWLALGDDDPAKLSAVFCAAENLAYIVSTDQAAQAEASQAISAAADWTAIARVIGQRADFYAERPYLRRVVVT